MGSQVVPAIKNNLSASTNPGLSDDSAAGYSVGSLWLRTDTGAVFRARSVAAGAAYWVKQGVADHPGYVATRWVSFPITGAVGTGGVFATGSIRFLPTMLSERITISDLGARLTTLAASGNAQFAIYASDGTTKKPTGNALAATGDVSTTTAGVISGDIVGADVRLEPGLYWMAINVDATAGGVAIFQTLAASNPHMSTLIGSTTLGTVMNGASAQSWCYTFASTYNTWPDMTGQTVAEVSGITSAILACKVASVP